MNEYFSFVCDLLQANQLTYKPDFTKLQSFINSKIQEFVFFMIPYISTDLVYQFINGFKFRKATCRDGIGPRIKNLANNVLAPSISALINKSIRMASFPGQ